MDTVSTTRGMAERVERELLEDLHGQLQLRGVGESCPGVQRYDRNRGRGLCMWGKDDRRGKPRIMNDTNESFYGRL